MLRLGWQKQMVGREDEIRKLGGSNLWNSTVFVLIPPRLP